MLKRATCPGSGYRICTDTAGVKVPCATVTPSRRVAGLPRRARKIMNTKPKGSWLPVFPGCQLYRWEVARLSGPSVNSPLQMRSNITKGEELGLLLHGDHHLFCEIRQTLDTHHPAITREQCEYYLPFRAGADARTRTWDTPALTI